MKETWRPVVGYEGLYEVSDLGRVRRLPTMAKHWTGSTFCRPLRVLAGSLDRDGYVRHGLHKSGECHGFRASRLVLLAFVGPPPCGKTDAAHIDGNRANNRMGNLAWKSSIENAADKHRHGTTARGERIGKATQTPGSVERIRDLHRAGCRQVDTSVWMGVSQSQVSAIARRQFWAHV